MIEGLGLHQSWISALARYSDASATKAAIERANEQRASGVEVYPPRADVFRAFELTPFDDVKVVIIGQDPYHGPGQAHGLSFSVTPGTTLPPSLRNIYKELEDDLAIPPADHGFLEQWARQGVLLLNDTLTVERGQPGSHVKFGWNKFTDAAVEAVARRSVPSVFILWGSFAQMKAEVLRTIDHPHLIISSPHPSPFAARKGFFGSRPFSRANRFLAEHGRPQIDWALPSLQSSLLDR